MVKKVKIGEREIELKSTGRIPLEYRDEFHRDFFADVFSLLEAEKDLSKLNTDIFYNLLWLYARKADESVGDIDEFYDSFDFITMDELINAVTEMITGSMVGINKKN